MALVAIAADKGSPGVTTAAIALATVWPRGVLLAECDPAGGDLAYRLPAARGGRLDGQRGLLSLAVAARRGLSADQVWEHTQQLHGGLPVLTGVTTAEQGAGLDALWGRVGSVLSELPETDVIADCGRLGVDGPFYDLLAQAASVILVMRATLGEVVRLRERVAAVAACGKKRNSTGPLVGVVAVVGQRDFSGTLTELGRALDQGKTAKLLGGIAYEPRSAAALGGQAGGYPGKSLLMRSARDIAVRLVAQLPAAEPGVAEPDPVAIPDRTRAAQIAAPQYRRSWPPAAGELGEAGHDALGRAARSAGNGAGREPAAGPLPPPGERQVPGERRRDYPRTVEPSLPPRGQHRAINQARLAQPLPPQDGRR
jgi:hypothetical protein